MNSNINNNKICLSILNKDNLNNKDIKSKLINIKDNINNINNINQDNNILNKSINKVNYNINNKTNAPENMSAEYCNNSNEIKPKQIRILKLEKLPVEKIIEALQRSSGLIGQAADILGVDRAALSRYIKRFPNDEISEAIFQGRQKFIDKCEGRLEKHVDSQDQKISLDAVKFALSTIGKERGYTTSASLEIDANISAVAPDISKIAEAAKKLENIIDIEIEED